MLNLEEPGFMLSLMEAPQLRINNSKMPKEAEGGEKRTIKCGRLPQWPSSVLPTRKSAGDSLETRYLSRTVGLAYAS